MDFSKLDLREPPVLIMKNISGKPIGTLGFAMHITADIKYNEASVLEFEIPAWVDGEAVPHYDAVVGMRVVELQDIGQFLLVNPKEVGDGVKKIKQCRGYSLEYEFTFKKLSLASATYNFWNPVTPESTLLQMILDMMPSWSLGVVDSALIGKYRTFEVSDENLYNFMKGTIQDAYQCIFDFDTMERRIHVKSASSTVPTNPVYLSSENLATEITVEENTEGIVTRLDVNGADGVNIRDVNPMGTNQIINLDYFMTTDNFDSGVIAKYHDWKSTYQNYQQQYYNLSVEYSLQVMRKTAEQAALTELESEMTMLENQQAVTIQAIAGNVMVQGDLDGINRQIEAKQGEIRAKKLEIAGIEEAAAAIYAQLSTINKKTRFASFFTAEEYLQIDHYIKDDAVSESSFVANLAESYEDEDTGNHILNKEFAITGATISMVANAQGKTIFDIKGGRVKSDLLDAEMISAAFECGEDNRFVMTAYLSAGRNGDIAFPKGCISVTGTVHTLRHDLSVEEGLEGIATGTSMTLVAASGYFYFTRNTSEYEKRAVAWDLFTYGNEILEKISQPSYTFSVTSSNFLGMDEFIKFKNKIRHGEKIYVGLYEGKTLTPICIGLQFDFDSPDSLSLSFSDTYISGDSSFLLADLLEQSVSMGKSVDLNKYSYSAFMDSGASTKVKDFMSTALDVSKNAILSSKEQAISWGDSGIRLRKWADDAHTEYEPKQVWMNNNSILMTSNNWATAELAIGNFYDKSLGECWGIVAPNIVGTLLAGSNLVIESAKQDGGVSVFKVDAEGCFLHNSNFSVTSDATNSHILIDPAHGFMIGKSNLIKWDGTIDDSKKVFFADTDGNLTLKGTVYATDGEFTGRITATSGYIGQPSSGWEITNSSIQNGRPTLTSLDRAGIYIGTDGISLGSSLDSYIVLNKAGRLDANNANISGHIIATSGEIGGCEIKDGTLKIANANITSISASKISTGTMSADRISGGTIDASDVTITNLSASNIKSGTLNGNTVKVTNLSASNITGGTLDCESVTIKNLNASSITVGQITASQINGLPASKITSGAFNSDRIANAAITNEKIGNEAVTNSKIKDATITSAKIQSLSANKISAGTIDANVVTIKNLTVSMANVTGNLSAGRISGGTLSGCSINIGSGIFRVTATGYAYMNITSLSVYSNRSVGTLGVGYHSGQTFEMTVVRNVTAAVVVSKIVLVFVQGVCCGWYSA